MANEGLVWLGGLKSDSQKNSGLSELGSNVSDTVLGARDLDRSRWDKVRKAPGGRGNSADETMATI